MGIPLPEVDLYASIVEGIVVAAILGLGSFLIFLWRRYKQKRNIRKLIKKVHDDFFKVMNERKSMCEQALEVGINDEQEYEREATAQYLFAHGRIDFALRDYCDQLSYGEREIIRTRFDALNLSEGAHSFYLEDDIRKLGRIKWLPPYFKR